MVYEFTSFLLLISVFTIHMLISAELNRYVFFVDGCIFSTFYVCFGFFVGILLPRNSCRVSSLVVSAFQKL